MIDFNEKGIQTEPVEAFSLYKHRIELAQQSALMFLENVPVEKLSTDEIRNIAIVKKHLWNLNSMVDAKKMEKFPKRVSEVKYVK